MMLVLLIAWMAYAYFFPHTWSGQLLIKVSLPNHVFISAIESTIVCYRANVIAVPSDSVALAAERAALHGRVHPHVGRLRIDVKTRATKNPASRSTNNIRTRISKILSTDQSDGYLKANKDALRVAFILSYSKHWHASKSNVQLEGSNSPMAASNRLYAQTMEHFADLNVFSIVVIIHFIRQIVNL